MRLYPLVVVLVLFLVACEKSSPNVDRAAVRDPATASSLSAERASASSAAGTGVLVGAPTAVDAGAGGDSASKIAGNNFTLELSSSACQAAAECEVKIRLVALGEYHVNKEYPYKFVANASEGLDFLGKSEPNTFSRAAGDLVEEGEKACSMRVRFKPAAAGEARVSGTYKFSVCSDEQCQIEQQKLELVVPVT